MFLCVDFICVGYPTQTRFQWHCWNMDLNLGYPLSVFFNIFILVNYNLAHGQFSMYFSLGLMHDIFVGTFVQRARRYADYNYSVVHDYGVHS